MRSFQNRFSSHLPAILAILAAVGFSADDQRAKLQLRRPIALQISEDEEYLLVANRRSGTISSIDLRRHVVVGESKVAQQLDDLVKLPGQHRYLAIDQLQHELILLSRDGHHVRIDQRVAVEPYPVSVVCSGDGKSCVVASLWSRRLTFVELPGDRGQKAKVVGRLDVPFAPRCQLLVRADTRLLVADSFGGRLAIVDPRQRKFMFECEIPGHNIRGLGVSADGTMLLVSHQMLNELAHTVRNDVHWGLLMSNDLRWLRLDRVLTQGGDIYQQSHMHPLGEAGRATADPAGLAITQDGTVIVTLGGVGEVAIGKEADFSLNRVRVGRRPTAVAVSRDLQHAYVANTFGDSISVVNLKQRQQTQQISLGSPGTLSLADRGELLFFDAKLSHDSWMSCHSCHTDGHTNGLLNDNFSDKSFGAPKRVLSLLGKADTAPFAWDGGAKDLDEQIRTSISVTMQSDSPPSAREVAALDEFVKTLEPPPPIDLARGERDEAAVARGSSIFTTMRCATCHAPPTFTSPKNYNVGLRDNQGNIRFNPPSLRGVGQRGPYFHDGRAKSLEDLFRNHGHKLPAGSSDEELSDLIAFLRSL